MGTRRIGTDSRARAETGYFPLLWTRNYAKCAGDRASLGT
jgi:hypothetical protein